MAAWRIKPASRAMAMKVAHDGAGAPHPKRVIATGATTHGQTAAARLAAAAAAADLDRDDRSAGHVLRGSRDVRRRSAYGRRGAKRRQRLDRGLRAAARRRRPGRGGLDGPRVRARGRDDARPDRLQGERDGGPRRRRDAARADRHPRLTLACEHPRAMDAPSDSGRPAGDPSGAGRAGMAAERTWLAWWRTALAATAAALAVGRVAPEALNVAATPYVVLGCGYAAIAMGLLVGGARRQRDLQRSIDHGDDIRLPSWIVAFFTLGGVALAIMTGVVVLAQG